MEAIENDPTFLFLKNDLSVPRVLHILLFASFKINRNENFPEKDNK